MHATKLIVFSIMTLIALSVSASAQRPGPEFWRRLTCEPFEARTKLEALEDKQEAVIIKGFIQINTVDVRGVNVDALELRDASGAVRAKGIVVILREGGEKPAEGRAYVDYEEINALLHGIDTLSGVNETATKLSGFEARYRTLGDLQITTFRQTRSGTAATLSTGICDRVSQSLSLDELGKFRALVAEAKTRLDEIK